jgi:hypothetical protein
MVFSVKYKQEVWFLNCTRRKKYDSRKLLHFFSSQLGICTFFCNNKNVNADFWGFFALRWRKMMIINLRTHEGGNYEYFLFGKRPVNTIHHCIIHGIVHHDEIEPNNVFSKYQFKKKTESLFFCQRKYKISLLLSLSY